MTDAVLMRDFFIVSILANRILTCGLYYKQVMIIIYDRNDSGQYYKTTITIIIDVS